MFEKIIQSTDNLESVLVNIRRYLHQNPELSSRESNTANYIHKKLFEAGLESSIVETSEGPAVIGYLKVDDEKETIAFRADMDALPIVDSKIKAYSSKNEGVMHACGHDFNMTCILGTALVLASIKQELDVNVKFIFQPSEESSVGGSEALIQEKVMEGVDAIWTIHAIPSLPAGQIGIRYGPITSATDTFKIKIKGKAGHSARPNRAVDAIFVANQIINCLYSSIPRSIDPLNPFVISIGKIHSGTAPNIIAEECEMEGTARTFNLDIREKIHDLIKLRSHTIGQAYDARVDIKWSLGPPPVINDRILTYLTQETAASLIGADNVIKIQKPSMGAEDFSRYLKFAPGMLVRIGTGGEDAPFPLHSSLFDVDDKAIMIAVKLLSGICLNFQQNKCESRDYIRSFSF